MALLNINNYLIYGVDLESDYNLHAVDFREEGDGVVHHFVVSLTFFGAHFWDIFES